MRKVNKVKEMDIQSEKYYKTRDVIKLSPILEARGYNWFLTCIHTGRIKTINTNPKKFPPRYLVKGSEVTKFIKELEG